MVSNEGLEFRTDVPTKIAFCASADNGLYLPTDGGDFYSCWKRTLWADLEYGSSSTITLNPMPIYTMNWNYPHKLEIHYMSNATWYWDGQDVSWIGYHKTTGAPEHYWHESKTVSLSVPSLGPGQGGQSDPIFTTLSMTVPNGTQPGLPAFEDLYAFICIQYNQITWIANPGALKITQVVEYIDGREMKDVPIPS